MEKRLTSFIVPVYNSGAWLRECAESILAQTVPDLELILVDDGSTDDSLQVCRLIAESDRRVRVLSTANLGPGAARNSGVEAASGSHVVFVDSDDTIHPEFLSVTRGMLEATGARAALCRFADDPRRLTAKGRVTTLAVPELIRRILYQDGYNCSLCGRLLPVDALRAAPLRTGIYYEDLDAFYRVYEAMGAGARVAATTARLYRYRQRPGSIIHTFSRRRLDVLDVTRRICEHYAADPALQAAARDRRYSAAYNMLVLCTRAGLTAEADECWATVVESRQDELRDPRVRMKNKIGAVLSHLGRRAVILAGKLVYRQ